MQKCLCDIVRDFFEIILQYVKYCTLDFVLKMKLDYNFDWGFVRDLGLFVNLYFESRLSFD